MHEFRPRDFTLGLFKFRLTPSSSMPTDGDLLRTITRGVRGTAMPSWHMLEEKDRLAVIQYIKYELAVDRSDPSRRSEEHTSELQSLMRISYAVFCLKKKKHNKTLKRSY